MPHTCAFPQYPPAQPPSEDGKSSFTMTIRPELVRCWVYFFFWSLVLLAFIITEIWAEPEEDAGVSKIFTLWDYSPSRELAAIYFPFLEYFLVIYIFLDCILNMMAYRNGMLPEWYWKITRYIFPICMLLTIWSRLSFVFNAYDDATKGNTDTVAFLQIALLAIAISNVSYILLTKESYPNCLKWSAGTAGFVAKIYLALNIVISVLKISGTNGLIDFIWIILNAVIPAFIAYVRMQNEDPLTIGIVLPAAVYDEATKPKPVDMPSSEGTPLLGVGGSDGSKDLEGGGGSGSPPPATTAPAPSATTDPASTDPATTDPATAAPATTDPATTDPATTAPATSDPATTAPAPAAPAEPEPPKPPPVVDPKIVLGQAALDGIKGTATLNSGLSEIYEIGHKAAEVYLQDGAWISDIFLPSGCPEGATLVVHCNSTWNTNIKNLKPNNRVVATKQRVDLKVVNGVWTEMAWVDEKGTLVIKGQEQLSRYQGTDGSYFMIVADGKVVHHSADLEDNKNYLNTKYGKGVNSPSRMIVDVSNGTVSEDPHTVGGQNQGGGVNAGFNKWWWNWNDIHAMTAVAKNYLKTNKVGGPPKNDNLLHAYTVMDYKDVEIQTWDGSWMRECILPSPDTILRQSTLTMKCGSTWAVKVTNPGKWTKTVNAQQTLKVEVVKNANGTKDWK